MKEELVDFDRKEVFENYYKRTNPFLFLSTKVDITNIYKKCKNYYPSIAYFITLAANKIDNFKYRYIDGKFYKYNDILVNFTEMFDDKNIGFFDCELKNNYQEFLNEYKNVKGKFLESKKSIASDKQDQYWFSCAPWYNINSLITPFDKDITVPQFIWDKFTFENDKCYINLMIMVHHGFVDGYHIGLFLQELNNIIDNIDDYL